MIDSRFDKFKNRELTEIKVTRKADNENIVYLRDFYPEPVGETETMIVDDELLYQLLEFKREEDNYDRKIKRQRINYSYDNEEFIGALGAYTSGIDNAVAAKTILKEAIRQISKTTYKRAVLHYIMGYSRTQIARMEGVNSSSITRSLDELRSVLFEMYKP